MGLRSPNPHCHSSRQQAARFSGKTNKQPSASPNLQVMSGETFDAKFSAGYIKSDRLIPTLILK